MQHRPHPRLLCAFLVAALISAIVAKDLDTSPFHSAGALVFVTATVLYFVTLRREEAAGTLTGPAARATGATEKTALNVGAPPQPGW